MADDSAPSPAPNRISQGPFRSKSLWLAIFITLAGAAWWGVSVATSGRATPVESASSYSSVSHNETGGSPPPPAAVRYGTSFIAAFLIAFVLKKLIKSVLLIAALLVGAILALKYLGVFNLDWASAQQQVEHGVSFASAEGEKYRVLAMGYLPSGLAAGAGAIFGARRG